MMLVAACASSTPSATERPPTSSSVGMMSPISSVATESAPAEAAPAEPEPAPVRAPTRADPFELTFVGDVHFGRYRADGFDPIADEGSEVFSEVTALLRSHLAIGNLETPLVRELPARSPIVSVARFGASARMAEPLVPAGFHAMSVANNHAYDLRRAGLQETPEVLAELGIVALGSVPDTGPVVRVQTIEREGWRVGVLAVATRLNGRRPSGLPPIPLVPTLELAKRLAPLVKEARASHDVIVVLVHWGEEYRDTPTAAQRSVAHALVRAGVDIVVGHHPHVLQGIERYGDGVIAYSLGNFLFDNPAELQRQTGVLRVRMRGDGRGCLDAVELHPVWLDDASGVHPVPATGEQGAEIEARVRRLSERMGTRWVEQGDAIAVDVPGCSS